VTNYVTAPAPINDLQTRNGLSLRDAQDKALKLAPGMTQDEVISLLGKPDETSADTYGTQTARPWNGITWYYRWDSEPSDANILSMSQRHHKNLSIIFEKGLGAWVVNSWGWSGF
jgi:outer membrane protein assembly factor BamE (lipoprotein component of BamABCDE complex)